MVVLYIDISEGTPLQSDKGNNLYLNFEHWGQGKPRDIRLSPIFFTKISKSDFETPDFSFETLLQRLTFILSATAISSLSRMTSDI